MPVDAGSLHYAVGPVAAVVVVVMLTLFIRWAFAPARDAIHSSTPAQQGLLRAVATTGSRESALALRAVLSDAGIRSSVSPRDPGHVDVLVFVDDLPRARPLALGFGQISDT